MDRWLKFRTESDFFIIKFDTDSSQTCWLSDFTTLWSESIDTKEKLLERFSAENPLVVLDEIEDQILKTLSSLPKKSENVQIIKGENDAITFKLKYLLMETIPLKFYWQLKKCDPKEFFENITKSLFHQLFELQGSQDELVEIIKTKDLEIEQYKLDGAQLMRKQFMTKPFDMDAHMKRFCTWNSNEFTEKFNFLRKTSNVQAESDSKSVEKDEIPSPSTKNSSRNTKRGRGNAFQQFTAPPKLEYEDCEDEDGITNSNNDNNFKDGDDERVNMSKAKRIRRTLNL